MLQGFTVPLCSLGLAQVWGCPRVLLNFQKQFSGASRSADSCGLLPALLDWGVAMQMLPSHTRGADCLATF